MQWINIKDKSPDNGIEVLFCNQSGSMVVATHYQGRVYTDDNAWDAEWFCYWMPLPEPPKDA